MKRVAQVAGKVVAGLLVSAMYALPQAYTVSARPGAINYVEGEASINGKIIQGKAVSGKAFLNRNDTLTTENGKVEVLLTPGVFVRVGEDSQLRMVSPDLTSTQVELVNGSAIVEVDQLVKDNNIQVLDSGATVKLQKNGLYRFTAGNQPVVQTLDGKADVSVNGKSVELGKNHQVALNGDVKRDKLQGDPQDTQLYAWSKVRDEYDAAASYASASNVATPAYGGPFGFGYGYGWGSGYYGAGFGPGWAWNPFWSTYAWLPGDGAFFSPFGFGFYAPAYVGYAPVIVRPVNGRPVTVPVTTSKPGVAAGAYRSGYFEGRAIHVPAAALARGGYSGAVAGRASYTAAGRGSYAAGPRASFASAPRASGGFSGGAAGAHAGGGGGHR